jgi:hypothetical protein
MSVLPLRTRLCLSTGACSNGRKCRFQSCKLNRTCQSGLSSFLHKASNELRVAQRRLGGNCLVAAR